MIAERDAAIFRHVSELRGRDLLSRAEAAN